MASSGVVAVAEARVAGAKIINMSYGAPVPAILDWSVFPFNWAINIVRADGALLFASAGNDAVDVDATDCFITCWEGAWFTPCENDAVICVGGLARNSIIKDSGANWGSNDGVDIYAPYNVIVGPDGDTTGNVAQIKSGTSFASPYTAGVAALIWA